MKETIWRCNLLPQYLAYKAEIDQAIQRVLHSGRYILANEVAQFEEEFAQYTNTRYSVSVANATDALTLALMAIDIKPGDEVITTPFTAIPTVSAIIDAGATPVFVDIDERSFLMDLNKVEEKLSSRTRAVMPVHIFGNVVNVKQLRELLPEGVVIIEDASQSHGSTFNGAKSGSLGDMGIFSFYPTKNLGAYGDGGAVVTNNQELYEKIKLIRMYGMVDYNTIIINGINSRLDELQAAILRVKLKYLDEMNEKRNVIAERYRKELTENFVHQYIDPKVGSNYHVFVSQYNGDRSLLIQALESEGIQTNIYYMRPLYLQPANKFLGLKKGACPVAETVCNKVIALPMYPELEDKTLDFIIRKINEFTND
jgi:dTDP-4-amino-4,6-dideoxygalactose transaminase